ncbi:MAG: glycosyltransferase family 4 protein [Alphaproteobacteria bacterium]|nr:glycosyltransferase family 4 protein [Alphaproteobacteria bacterium]
MKHKKLLYLVANDRYFCSHRLSLALAAKEQDYDVYVATPALGDHEKIINADLKFIPLPFQRGGMNPFKELKTIYQIWKLYQNIRPDIVHHVAIKPVLYGTIAAFFSRVPLIINAVAGLGHIFANNSWLKTPLKIAMRSLLSLKNVQIIVQNPEDFEEIKSLTQKDNIHLLLGAGVNLKEFYPIEESKAPPFKIIHVSRLLWSKGIKELVEAGKILKRQGHNIIIQIVGEPDLENPDAIPAEVLQEWHNNNLIEWLGHRVDIANLYQQAHIACLASYYREGIPKSLIEAAACGKSIITCDMPGCRIIVEHNKNGYLISPRDSEALANAILNLISDDKLRQQMGHQSRAHAESAFGEEKIHKETIKLYTCN